MYGIYMGNIPRLDQHLIDAHLMHKTARTRDLVDGFWKTCDTILDDEDSSMTRYMIKHLALELAEHIETIDLR